MRRRIATLAALIVLVGALGSLTAALAHECTTDPDTGQEECHPTPVYPNWRPNRVPVLGLDNRDDPEQRREAQRWRDEWGCRQQFCVWLDFSNSVNSGTPNEIHAGMAGDHSFLGEAAHQSEGHGTNEGNHDSHGGALYADICLAEDEGTSYQGMPGECDEGLEDTQVGLTVLDHNPCPACEDNYHLVRPFDNDCEDADQPSHRRYCNERMFQNSMNEIQFDVTHPVTWFCGYRDHRGFCQDSWYDLEPISPPVP